jgi:hypothetical protein
MLTNTLRLFGFQYILYKAHDYDVAFFATTLVTAVYAGRHFTLMWSTNKVVSDSTVLHPTGGQRCDTNFIYSIYLNSQFLNTVIIITNVHLRHSVIKYLT